MKIEDPEEITVAPDGRSAEEQPRWRRDFPVDWPEDEYRSRREFTWLLMLTSLAFATGQAWIVVLSYLRNSRGKPQPLEITRTGDLPVGGTMLFQYPKLGDACVLVRINTDQYVAYSQKCTHLSCPVIPKTAVGELHCPCHEGVFDMQTGRPLAGPPRRPLPRIRLEVRNGRIFATGIDEGQA